MQATVGEAAVRDQQLDDTFFALSNATRRAILERLAEGEASVNELAEPFEMSLPAISKHLKVLERAGLVTRTRVAQSRPCAFSPAPLVAATSWVENQHRIWSSRFDQLEAQLAKIQNNEKSSEEEIK